MTIQQITFDATPERPTTGATQGTRTPGILVPVTMVRLGKQTPHAIIRCNDCQAKFTNAAAASEHECPGKLVRKFTTGLL